jgi:hypothetical protein
LSNDLNLVTATAIYETTLKTVISTCATRLQQGRDEWTASEKSTLHNIASMCRYEGGLGVVMARAILEETRHNDNALYPGISERGRSSVLTGTVTPNPASDICRLHFSSPETGLLSVKSLNGQCVYSSRLQQTAIFDLNASSWPNGVYFAEMRSEKGPQYLYKIAIAH